MMSEREKKSGAQNPPPAQARQCHHGIRGGTRKEAKLGKGGTLSVRHTHTGRGGDIGNNHLLLLYAYIIPRVVL